MFGCVLNCCFFFSIFQTHVLMCGSAAKKEALLFWVLITSACEMKVGLSVKSQPEPEPPWVRVFRTSWLSESSIQQLVYGPVFFFFPNRVSDHLLRWDLFPWLNGYLSLQTGSVQSVHFHLACNGPRDSIYIILKGHYLAVVNSIAKALFY